MLSPRLLGSAVSLLLVLLVASPHNHVLGLAVSKNNRGSAAKPFEKKKVAIAGVGGYAGAVTFGFLQRAASLYGTGIGAVRAVGATADTASRLNSNLSKHFCLAFADESVIKLCNLMESPESIAAKLQGFDALVLGTDVGLSQRTVTLGTYERTPNDKTLELYWPRTSNLVEPDNVGDVKLQMLQNFFYGAQLAGLKHICLVDDAWDDAACQALDGCGVPYTCLRPTGVLTERPNYTYRIGVNEAVYVEPYDASAATVQEGPPIFREDLAALAVQCLLSLDWASKRVLLVTSQGVAPDADWLATGPRKRPDQEWCVNSFAVEQALFFRGITN